MDISVASCGILDHIRKKYKKYINNGSIDINQLVNICELNVCTTHNKKSIRLSEIEFTSPQFSNIPVNTNTKNIIKSKEFRQKYAYFVKLIYACLKMNTNIFEITDGIMIMKNNYHLIKSLNQSEKKLILDHIDKLKYQHKNIDENMSTTYSDYVDEFVTKIKIIEKIIHSINRLLETKILTNSDNLLKLLLPYFYTYIEYIEEYN